MIEQGTWRTAVAVVLMLVGLATGRGMAPAGEPIAAAQTVDCEMARALATQHGSGVLILVVRAVDYARQGDAARVEDHRARLVDVELGALVYVAELVAEACTERP